MCKSDKTMIGDDGLGIVDVKGICTFAGFNKQGFLKFATLEWVCLQALMRSPKPPSTTICH